MVVTNRNSGSAEMVIPAATLAGDKRFVTLTANAVKQEVDCFRSNVSADELYAPEE